MGKCCHCPSVGISTALQVIFPSEGVFQRDILFCEKSVMETHNRKSLFSFPLFILLFLSTVMLINYEMFYIYVYHLEFNLNLYYNYLAIYIIL